MPDVQQGAAPPAGQAAPARGQAQQEESPFRKFLGIAQQMLFIWFVTQMASKFFAPKPTTPQAPPATTNEPGKPGTPNPWSLPPVNAELGWPLGQPLALHVYLSTSFNGDVFSKQWTSKWRENQDEGLPTFVWDNITFGDYSDKRVSVLNNGSLWADVFLVKAGSSPDPQNPTFDPEKIHHIRKLLTPYFARVKVRKEKNLISGGSAEEEEEEQPDVIVPHWHRNLTLALVSDATVVPYGTLPPPIRDHIYLAPGKRDSTGTKGYYKPIVFPNEFWHLKSHYTELNSTTPTMPLQIEFQPMSYMKFQIFASMTHGFNEAAKQQGAGASAELDEIKRMLLETNPWFLGLTGLFRDASLFVGRVALEAEERDGRCLRQIITNVFVQIVVLLYLIDNNENTSWMILFGSGMGVIIEAWKITKAVDISFAPASAGSFFPYKLDIKDKHVLSEDEKKTQEYDRLAFRYVSYFAIPSLAIYTVYSLLYESHRGWYSFIISTLTSFVYMFGFAQLVPQLIINYKLKSVAHMPMKAMIYKTLSTVVDDLFAFCIKMPFLHRLACFRDDVVFLIFLYQRWIYRIDPKRINEYGQVMAEDVKAIQEEKTEKTESKKNR
ncbi:hypothetical protein V5O48_001498 [Marasmius crinis-equi]|uniref:Cleft lip and palate associated transmembrane protein n=1 Tax=Marasmius crinis-equi TaxID=585013 RepID=A0ABR3FYR4_9AGAR